ncbi:MAG: hypothetical protein H6751_01895 [Candidatus Omnitrophica bacterium]|nr:hypothetical protein [Candidatus Omnitrophota bacterium]
MEISRSLKLILILQLLWLPNAWSDADWVAKRLNEPLEVKPSHLEQISEFLISRIPPLILPSSPEAWTAEAQTLRDRILEEVVFKGVPDSWREGNHSVTWGDTIETGKGYKIKKLYYECLPGLYVSALLYEPDNLTEKVPAILNVNGHNAPGKSRDVEQIRCINLAKRGMLALHPEWLSFGDLETYELRHNRGAYLDMCGISSLATFYLAMRGGLDVLLAHEHADPNRVAMTGLSGGGWQTIVLSSLDTRITACTPNAGYSSLEDRVKNRSDIGDLEQSPIDLLTIADYTHLTAMLAPRPALLIYNKNDDCCFKAERAIPSVYDPIVPFYELYGKANVFTYHINEDPGTHNYKEDNRQHFYKFLYENFLPDQKVNLEELQTEEEILSDEALSVPLPEDNATYISIAKEQFDRLPLYRFENLSGEKLESAKAEARGRLREVLRLPEWETRTEAVIREEDQGMTYSVDNLILGEDWKLPVHDFSKGNPEKTTILIADGGIASATEKIARLVDNGYEVRAVDLLFFGTNVPGDTHPWQFAQMFTSIGHPGLGVQVGQLLAVVDQVEGDVEIVARGSSSEVIALAAGALNPDKIEVVRTGGKIKSFKDGILAAEDYHDNPTFYCFGLLEVVDVPQLRQLCAKTEER